jgi:hypothetical protein
MQDTTSNQTAFEKKKYKSTIAATIKPILNKLHYAGIGAPRLHTQIASTFFTCDLIASSL